MAFVKVCRMNVMHSIGFIPGAVCGLLCVRLYECNPMHTTVWYSKGQYVVEIESWLIAQSGPWFVIFSVFEKWRLKIVVGVSRVPRELVKL